MNSNQTKSGDETISDTQALENGNNMEQSDGGKMDMMGSEF